MLDQTKSFLPRRPRGRPTPEKEDRYQKDLRAFCNLMLEIQSTMDFRVGVRGWCYILEKHGLFKGEFPECERLITKCRKSGDLPTDICAEDDNRALMILSTTITTRNTSKSTSASSASVSARPIR